MKRKLQFAGWLAALGMSAALAVPCFAQGTQPNGAQNRQDNKPPRQQSRPPQRQLSREQPPRQQPRPEQRREQRQEIDGRIKNWEKLTPEQKNHVRNELAPKWNQLPPNRQRAIQQRLGVLQNMPESARNHHLIASTFTWGRSVELAP